MKQLTWMIPAVWLLSSAVGTQPAQPPRAGQGASRPSPATAPAEKLHFRIDKQRRIVIEAEVCRRSGYLEFLLCRQASSDQRESKEHESILRTRARPRMLHAALLALGLSPGKPARWSGEHEGAVFLPPRGPELKITFRWKDANGKVQQADAVQWLKHGQRGTRALPKKWVFVGSEVLPDGRYWADLAGEIVSVSNFASAVIDVPFESSDKDGLQEFEANPQSVPPLGTPVEVTISLLPGATGSPHARAMLEIDRRGDLYVGSRPIAFGDLTKWAEKYLSRHDKGMVVIRAAARARVHDIQRVRDELKFGGVLEIEEQRLGPDEPLLPRTPAQAKEAVQQWKEKFANPREYLTDPGEEAKQVLKQIEREMAELDRLRALWTDYRTYLQGASGRHKPPVGSRQSGRGTAAGDGADAGAR